MSSANILNGIILLVKPHFSSLALAAFHFPVVPYIYAFGGKQRFSAGAAVTQPFLHSSILYLFKATVMSNLRAVTLYLVEFL